MPELDEQVVEGGELELVVGAVEPVEEEQHDGHAVDERLVGERLALVRRGVVPGRQLAFDDHALGVPPPRGAETHPSRTAPDAA